MIADRQTRIRAAQEARESAAKQQAIRDYSRQFMAALRDGRKAAGVCVRCAQPARAGKSECAICGRNSVERSQASRRRLKATKDAA